MYPVGPLQGSLVPKARVLNNQVDRETFIKVFFVEENALSRPLILNPDNLLSG